MIRLEMKNYNMILRGAVLNQVGALVALKAKFWYSQDVNENPI